MTRQRKRPIRTAPINKSPYFILAQPIRSIDRIQLSIKNRGSNYELILNVFRESLNFRYERRGGDGDGYRVKWLFTFGKFRIFVIFYGNYWFSIQVMDPDDDIQILLRDLILQAVPLNDVSLSQVEFALDFYPDEESKAENVFEVLSNHAVLKGIRARYARRVETSHYQGPPNKLHSGPRKLIVYRKEEHGRCFTRVELEAHKETLKRHHLEFNCFPLYPDDIDVLDYVTFRKKIDIRTVAERTARARFVKSPTANSRRRRLVLRTLGEVIRNILTRALESNPRYEINDLTAAEQIAMLKANLSPRSRFKICLVRHFPAFPKGRCGNVRWKA